MKIKFCENCHLVYLPPQNYCRVCKDDIKLKVANTDEFSLTQKRVIVISLGLISVALFHFLPEPTNYIATAIAAVSAFFVAIKSHLDNPRSTSWSLSLGISAK